MIEAALHWISVFFLADFVTVVVLVVLVQFLSRRNSTPARLTCSFGVVVFFGVCLALIYGGLWMMFHVAK